MGPRLAHGRVRASVLDAAASRDQALGGAWSARVLGLWVASLREARPPCPPPPERQAPECAREGDGRELWSGRRGGMEGDSEPWGERGGEQGVLHGALDGQPRAPQRGHDRLAVVHHKSAPRRAGQHPARPATALTAGAARGSSLRGGARALSALAHFWFLPAEPGEAVRNSAQLSAESPRARERHVEDLRRPSQRFDVNRRIKRAGG
jgi:hypothetical protein